jgi:hypothetical membrane protein
MTRDGRLAFGLVAALIFAIGMAGLPLLIPGYSQIRQTVSEIGEMGSPARIPFAALLCVVGAALIIFASGLHDTLRRLGHVTIAAWLTGFMAISAAGVGIFAYPHPLHNVFGTSELIAYQAPLALALTLRSDPRAGALARFSWIMTILVWSAIAANLVVFDRTSALWAEMRPFYGLVQRALFVTWFVWCAGVGLLAQRC